MGKHHGKIKDKTLINNLRNLVAIPFVPIAFEGLMENIIFRLQFHQ